MRSSSSIHVASVMIKNLPNPKNTYSVHVSTQRINIFQTQRWHLQSFKCENFVWSWWPRKQGQGETYDMVTDLWAFLYSIGYNGKFNFDS